MGNKAVQGLWIGGSLSLLEQLSLKSFMAHGHEYHLYIYEGTKNIPDGVIIKDANEIIPKSEIYKSRYAAEEYSYLGFSDYFRVKLIYDRGGFWVDTDIICLKYFDFQDDYVFASEKSDWVKNGISSSIFKCPQNAIFLKEMYDEIHTNPLKKTEHGNILYMFPKYVEKYKFKRYLKDRETFSIFDPNNIIFIINKKYDEEFYSKCYSVHLIRQFWVYNKEKINHQEEGINKQIRLKGILDINKIYPKSTAYGFWQKKYL